MKSAKQLLREIETVKRHISAERDKLRELIDDFDSIYTSAEDCLISLESAADSLSQYL